jgi:hypothetical protein
MKQELMTKYETDIANIMQTGTSVTVKTEENYAVASQLIRDTKELAKKLDDERKEKVAPINATLNEINNYYQPKIKSLIKVPGSSIVSLQEKLTEGISQYLAIKKAEADKINMENEIKRKQEQDRLLEKARLDQEKAAELREKAERETEKMQALLIKKAEKIEEKAEISIENAVTTVASVVTIPKYKNDKLIWKFSGTVYDKAEFVKNCLDTGSLHLIDIDQKTLDAEIALQSDKNTGVSTYKRLGVTVTKKPYTRT